MLSKVILLLWFAQIADPSNAIQIRTALLIQTRKRSFGTTIKSAKFRCKILWHDFLKQVSKVFLHKYLKYIFNKGCIFLIITLERCSEKRCIQRVPSHPSNLLKEWMKVDEMGSNGWKCIKCLRVEESV